MDGPPGCSQPLGDLRDGEQHVVSRAGALPRRAREQVAAGCPQPVPVNACPCGFCTARRWLPTRATGDLSVRQRSVAGPRSRSEEDGQARYEAERMTCTPRRSTVFTPRTCARTVPGPPRPDPHTLPRRATPVASGPVNGQWPQPEAQRRHRPQPRPGKLSPRLRTLT